MLMTKYTYEITTEGDLYLVTLTNVAEPTKFKVFKMSAARDLSRLQQHMNTLTDDLCDEFWPRARPPKKKKEQANGD